jgi:hypothetical protein
MSETLKTPNNTCSDALAGDALAGDALAGNRVRPESPPSRPSTYEPPAIELRLPLETTAAFCDTAINGKEFPLCTGPINS